MTKQEKVIVSAYTGVLMCDFSDVHEYVEEKLGRPIFTHEFADRDIQKEIKEKSKEDFLKICSQEEPKKGKWILKKELEPLPWDCLPSPNDDYDEETHSIWRAYYHCSNCDWKSGVFEGGNYCPNCGARMDKNEM